MTINCRVAIRPDLPGGHFVLIARAPAEPSFDNLTRPGMSALVTHDPGDTWPDRTGRALVRAILEEGGTAFLGFSRMADAFACHARLQREGAM